MYFTPEPVLNKTTRSLLLTWPASINFLNAGKHAAPSGAQKTPSSEPISPVASINSWSVTAIAVPPEFRSASRIRKSPTAFGTRKPDAVVGDFLILDALRNSGGTAIAVKIGRAH